MTLLSTRVGVQSYMKIANRIHIRQWVLVLILGTSTVFFMSCQSWPPMKEELVKNFFLHRESIEQLAMNFSDSAFLGIRHGSAAADVYASSDTNPAQRPLSSELGERFRRYLEEANVFGIIKVGKRIVVIPYYNNFQSGNIISAQYVFEDGLRGDPSCSQFTSRSKEVECYVQLDNGWALMYNKVDRQEQFSGTE